MYPLWGRVRFIRETDLPWNFHPAVRASVEVTPRDAVWAMGPGAEPRRDRRNRPHCFEFGDMGRRGLVSQGRMRPGGVVIGHPGGDDGAGLGQAGEHRLVEQFVAHAAVETLDEAVLHGPAGGRSFPACRAGRPALAGSTRAPRAYPRSRCLASAAIGHWISASMDVVKPLSDRE